MMDGMEMLPEVFGCDAGMVSERGCFKNGWWVSWESKTAHWIPLKYSGIFGRTLKGQGSLTFSCRS